MSIAPCFISLLIVTSPSFSMLSPSSSYLFPSWVFIFLAIRATLQTILSFFFVHRTQSSQTIRGHLCSSCHTVRAPSRIIATGITSYPPGGFERPFSFHHPQQLLLSSPGALATHRSPPDPNWMPCGVPCPSIFFENASALRLMTSQEAVAAATRTEAFLLLGRRLQPGVTFFFMWLFAWGAPYCTQNEL